MPASLTDYVPATNRFVTGINPTDNAYDVAGNLTRNKLGELLAYDANNRQTSYTSGAATTLYHYDAQGNRVKKSGPSGTSIYVYDAFGKLAAEYKDSGTPTPGTFYRTVDHLGSTRLVTDAAGTEVENTDYLPFGEEIDVSLGDARHNVAAYGSPGQLRHKFTGKERDTESGMDYFLARYYSGPMGRFLSADPDNAGAILDDPQAWNAYAYVRNTPTIHTDPDGRIINFKAAAGAAAIGFLVDVGVQVFRENKSLGDVNFKRSTAVAAGTFVGVATFGAVTGGGAAVVTLSGETAIQAAAPLAANIGPAAVGGVVGGAVEKGLTTGDASRALGDSPVEPVMNAVTGVMSEGAEALAKTLVRQTRASRALENLEGQRARAKAPSLQSKLDRRIENRSADVAKQNKAASQLAQGITQFFTGKKDKEE